MLLFTWYCCSCFTNSKLGPWEFCHSQLLLLADTTLYSIHIDNFLVFFNTRAHMLLFTNNNSFIKLITQINLKHPMTTRIEGLHFCDCHMHGWSRVFSEKDCKIYLAITFFTRFHRSMSLLELCLFVSTDNYTVN